MNIFRTKIIENSGKFIKMEGKLEKKNYKNLQQFKKSSKLEKNLK